MKKIFGRFLNRLGNVFDSEDPFIIQAYRGYANRERFFLKGRVMENEGIYKGRSQSKVRILINNLKRFETDELAFARVRLHFDQETRETIADEEGYFYFDGTWPTPLEDDADRWQKIKLKLAIDPPTLVDPVKSQGEIFYPSPRADFGIITDIDDTVLQSHTSSRFRLKLLYATFFKDVQERLPMEGIVELFQTFAKGGDGQQENPIFYVSHSPWNIYDLLEEFLEIQQLPKGPILLRDYGWRPSGPFHDHKMVSIRHILEKYPHLPFILLGDTASRDTDFYLELAKKHEGRIKAIYIRQTRNTGNARRVAKLIEENSHLQAILVNNSREIIDHARKIGLL